MRTAGNRCRKPLHVVAIEPIPSQNSAACRAVEPARVAERAKGRIRGSIVAADRWRKRCQRLWLLTIAVWGTSLCGGCATTPYRYGRFHAAAESEQAPDDVVFEYGEPHKVLDGMAWLVALPTRVLPMHPKVNSHTLSEETAGKLETYLLENDLADVLVRVNQYDPAGEWRRLRENKRISAGWRYTFGTASVISYAVIPGRVFGGDGYNPFTNSLYVNSDVSAMLIAEAAYAKDIHSRSMPGAYAAVNEVPILTLWRHTHAVNDTLGYAMHIHDWELERETYRTVYPLMGIKAALGGHTAASWGTVLPSISVPITAIAGAVVGHAVGQSTIAQRERERSLTAEELAQKESAEATKESLDLAGTGSGVQLIGFEEILDPESPVDGTDETPNRRRPHENPEQSAGYWTSRNDGK